MLNVIERIKYKIVSGHIEEPIFLVVFGRSGSTALFRAISEHSEILKGRKESPMVEHFGKLIYEYYFSPEKEETKKYRKNTLPFDDFTTTRKFKSLIYEFATHDNYLKKLRYSKNKKKWIVGTYCNVEIANGLMKIFPSAKFVFIHRNGIDQVNSALKYFDHLNNDFEEACKSWNYAASAFSGLLNLENCFSISHHNLVENPSKIMTALLSFLDLHLEENCIKYISDNIVHPQGQNDANGNYSEYLKNRKEIIWTDEQKRQFLQICEQNMRLYGYDRELDH